MKNQNLSIHESLPIGIVLAISGGAMDTYTYLLRGETFATMQSANVLMLGVNLAQFNWSVTLRYLLPILSFIVGTMLVELFKGKIKDNTKRLDWQHHIVIIEIVLLLCCALWPNLSNVIANTIISFVAALQVGAYRSLSGVPFATTMTTGNIRTAAEHLYYFIVDRDKNRSMKSKNSFIITFSFFIGALASSFLLFNFKISPIWTSITTLIIVVVWTYIYNHKCSK